MDSVNKFVKSIYHGTLNFKDESLHPLFNIFGIPYNLKTTTNNNGISDSNDSKEFSLNDSLGDSDADSEESYIEPVLQLDIDHHRRQSAEWDFL